MKFTTVQTIDVESGMMTIFGLILRVDRCAPEHGGGILIMTPLGDVQITESVNVYGIVDAQVLADQRQAWGILKARDYSAGIR